MTPQETIAALVGRWEGTYRLWLEPGQLRTEGPTTCIGRPVLGGRLVALDYEWTDVDGPQSGTMLLGCTDQGTWEMALADTWHTGSSIMLCTGAGAGAGPGPSAEVLGTYGPPEQPWGWRTRLEVVSADEVVITAWNVTPTGEAAKATEATYRRR
jgi:hypothetical protein